MAYKTIKNKTYNNVKYIGKLIQTKKGYPYRLAMETAVKQFDAGIFNYWNVETLLNNLVSYEEYKQREKMLAYNLQGIH